MKHSPLSGLKVVELASVLAGPAVGMFLAELGAEVLKIENSTTGGDVTRNWKAPGEAADAPTSAYYHSVNHGKTSLLLDLYNPYHKAEVLQRIAEADVVIANFKPGAAEKLGMDYGHLKALNPRLIFAEITGYGAADPRPAFDVVLQAETGFLYLTGEAGGPPVKMPVALIDLLAAHQLKEAVLLALMHRMTSGQGSKVSVSLYDAAIASLANQATNWLIAGYAPQRMGTRHPNIAPYGDLFTTADGKQLVLAVGIEQHFRQLCAVLGLEELCADERFTTNTQRVRHRDAMADALQTQIATFNGEELLLQLHQHGVPAGLVRSIPEVFEQARAKELLLTTQLPDGREAQCVRSVVFAWD